MTTRRREKPDSATEAARVLRIFDLLAEEMLRRFPAQPIRIWDASKATITESALLPTLLEIADRIAYRTEDPE